MKIEFLSLMGKYLTRRYSDGIDADMSERDYLTPGEAIEYWGLSQRKFYSFLKEGPFDFLAFYNTRRLILRVSFERYLWRNPTIWEVLKNNGKKSQA